MTVARRVGHARGARAAAALLALALACVAAACAPQRALVLTESTEGARVSLHVGKGLLLLAVQ